MAIDFHKELITFYAKTWNNLNTDFLQDRLSSNVIYQSQWLLTAVAGNENLIRYLNLKFLAIHELKKLRGMTVTAELATHPDVKNKQIIVLTQKDDHVFRRVSVLIHHRNKRISRIDICFDPDPEKAILTGIVPK